MDKGPGVQLMDKTQDNVVFPNIVMKLKMKGHPLAKILFSL